MTEWTAGARNGLGVEEYPPIADHGLIGDLQTAALVATDGTIDWYCSPRFDSHSLFAALLDREAGGFCRIRPVGKGYVTRQLYFPDTAILVTRFMAPEGVSEVLDFMPVADRPQGTPRHRLVRLVRVVRGQVAFEYACAPRFDYGRQTHQLQVTEHGAVFRAGDTALVLHTQGSVGRSGDDVAGRTPVVRAGQVAGVMLETGTDSEPRAISSAELTELFDETVRFWRGWLSRSTYTGRWREAVNRSAITLKLMTYAPTGALIAAPTAGLPEQVGGERNWDYRYTWIRDASFSVGALLGLGFTDEADAFARWLGDRVHEQAGQQSGPLKIMYRIDGSSDLDEEVLHHLEGYRGSHPVRIGNGAADQLQLDIYGEAMEALYLTTRHSGPFGYQGWERANGIMRWLSDHWDQPEEGIWETRGGRRDFVYGRVMCWVALDRAIRMAQERGWPADVPRLAVERDRIYRQVMERGWHGGRGAFVQHYETDVLDASVLLMPILGFIAPRDPLWLDTLRAMDQELVSDSLVYRYDPEASPDGLRGVEATFSLCTFWYVDALARAGRLERARLTFEKMLTYGNHLGLFGEEIGPTGEQLGNFPQAFTHLGLINAALNLNRLLDEDRGRVRGVPESLEEPAPAERPREPTPTRR